MGRQGNGRPANTDWLAGGDQIGAWLGWSLGTAGDVNGEGYDDVVGAWLYDHPEASEGWASVYHGQPGPVYLPLVIRGGS